MTTEHEQQEIGIMRQLLRNEVTWTIFIIGILWGAVAGVVLPIQKIQIQIAQIQEQMTSDKTWKVQIETRVGKLETDHAIMLSNTKI